ncbi:hypothetical protein CFS9_37520 [Flavobacterium sp. CFS9]|uniref:MgtC/SapB/SrpB/YhiD N-terminal domain-containing protein n=2 Tax=Flavobacteriaceae TaxID=49546 RepID=A0AAT9H6Y8_9FLAO
MSAKLVLAAFLGGIIGLEREREQQNTGLRTFACICAASCLFVSIAGHLTEDVSAVARMLAAIATGLGFIGAGIIFRDQRNLPKGITTAAGLWTTSAVGMAVALDMLVIAVSATFIILLIFSINHFSWYRRLVDRLIKSKKRTN